MRGGINDIGKLRQIADKHGKKPAHVVLRWDLQKNICTIPKSSNPDHIRTNTEIFDFELSPDEMDAIDRLDQDFRTGDHPDHF